MRMTWRCASFDVMRERVGRKWNGKLVNGFIRATKPISGSASNESPDATVKRATAAGACCQLDQLFLAELNLL